VKTFFNWVLIIIGFSLVFNMLNTISNGNRNEPVEVSLSQFITAIEKKEVEEVIFVDNYTMIGVLKVDSPSKKKRKIQTVADTSNPKLFEILEKNKIIPTYKKPPKPSILLNLLFSLLPLILLFGFLILLFKKSPGGGGGIGMFGQSKARQISKYLLNVTFNDVAGLEETKEELEEVVDFLKQPNKFKKLGGRVPKGVLMQGPPGTGKTLLARAVAGEANVPFFFVSGSEFVEMFVGVGASRVRDLFEQAKRNAPCVIFIDEIDAVGKQRGIGLNAGHDEREQTLNQLLVEMDGFQSNSGIIVIAATNRADVLDKALLRPGRFDRIVTVENPDVKGREAILKVHTREVILSSNVDLKVIARGTTGFSGAELENLVNEAAIAAARKDKKEVEMADFEYARDKLLMGAEKKSRVMSEEERRVTAYHEAGHAIVGKMLKNTDPIHKVTIIPRGRALGVTQTLPEQDRLSMTKDRAEDFIAFLMGGRIAEELVIEQVTTGASNDIERATELAKRMVTEWGMSAKLGPLNYTIKQTGFAEQPKEHSEKTSETIDEEIRRIVESNYDRAKNILQEKITALHEMAKVLLEKETIDAEEVNRIVQG
jgi:cell division protease FtsH